MSKTKINKEEIINELKKRKEEMKPDQYNGCYKLVRETVYLLGKTDKDKLDYNDLDLLNKLPLVPNKCKTNTKIKHIKNKSNLSQKNKNILINLLNDIKEKTNSGAYKMDKIGLVGTGSQTVNRKGKKPTNKEIIRLIEFFYKINNENYENKCINLAEDYLSKSINNFQAGSASTILHCIKPFYFPILNSAGIKLYTKLGLDLNSPKELTKYPDNTKKIKKFRDNKFNFRNYRIIDEYNDKLLQSEKEGNGYTSNCLFKKGPNNNIDEELYFENQNLTNQIHTALKTGKHIILNGPPGTGKSKLAKEICKYYCGNGSENYTMTTATSDWSTFDTIGGLMPDNKDGNKLEFTKGIFLECFQDEYDNPANKWLILDEINRADIDKAFGALFSALTGDRVTLPQKRNGHEIEIIGDVDTMKKYNKRIEQENIKDNPHKFIIHPDWRIIATMNTFDKASLYEMSYAFMRRFAFINIGVPDIEHIDKKLLNKYITLWNKNDLIKVSNMVEHLDDIASLWKKINDDFKPIGPAIIEDILRYVSEILNMDNKARFDEALTDAIAMYVIPQFEGLSTDALRRFYDDLKEEDYIIHENLEKIIEDFFQVVLTGEENG